MHCVSSLHMILDVGLPKGKQATTFLPSSILYPMKASALQSYVIWKLCHLRGTLCNHHYRGGELAWLAHGFEEP